MSRNKISKTCYPQKYSEFQGQQQSVHYEGVKEAQRLIEKICPGMKLALEGSRVWMYPIYQKGLSMTNLYLAVTYTYKYTTFSGFLLYENSVQ